jgi:hypothetical protein
MINHNTVFILGAGASMPYGLPSGEELRQSICHDAIAETEMRHVFTTELEIPGKDLRIFSEAFSRSLQPSIDTFLAKRPNFSDIGKLCIAYQLCHRENPAKIFHSDTADHWYRELWHAMTSDLNGHMFLRHNKVRFVTFNYDRSLEFSLHEATKHTFGLDDAQARQCWEPIPICHVYGQLGEFCPATGDGRDYSKDVSPKSLYIAANGIKIIPEAREDDTEFQMVRTWFEWAERICFLGFSYDELNMKRLGLDTVIEWVRGKGKKSPWVVASTFGLTSSEVNHRLLPYLKLVDSHAQLPSKNLMVLRDTGILW